MIIYPTDTDLGLKIKQHKKYTTKPYIYTTQNFDKLSNAYKR